MANIVKLYTSAGDGGGYSNYTLRGVHDISAAGFTGTTAMVRVWVPPTYAGTSWTFDKIFVGEGDGGTGVDFSSAPTQVFFGGVANGESGTSGIWSDWLEIRMPSTAEMVTSVYTNTPGGNPPYLSSDPVLVRGGQVSGDYASTVGASFSVNAYYYTALGFQLETSLFNILSQPYDLVGVPITTILTQPYDIRQFLLTILKQPYGAEFLAILTQPYADLSVLTAILYQYYDSRPELLKILRQEYGDKANIVTILTQTYDLRDVLLNALKQRYSLLTDVSPAILKQIYDIQLNHEHLAVLKQGYSLFEDSSVIEPSVSVTVGGNPVEVSSVNYDYDIDQYCASFQLTVPEYSDWLSIDYRQNVVVSINGVDHHSVVIDMNSSISVSSLTYTVDCKSPAVLLDFPFATKVPEGYVVSGVASTVVSYLAALEGMVISWELDSDPPLTSTTTVAGGSPLAGIKEIVNALGGRIQSHPDGSIHAVKRYSVNTNEYDIAATTVTLTTGMDFTVLNTDVDKRYGYNKYFVSDSVSNNGATLRTESITSHKYKVMGSKVPWSTDLYLLETSELTNISISYIGITEETVSEEVEIVGGSGSVQYPSYGVVSYSYPDRTDLGLPEITEEGTITTAVSGESIVNISYTTRYHLWEVTDTDKEKVQLILVKP